MIFVGGILTVVLVGRGVVPVSRGVHVIPVVYAHRYVSGLAAFAASFVSRGVVLLGRSVILVTRSVALVGRGAIPIAAFFIFRPDCRECVVAADFVGVARIIL